MYTNTYKYIMPEYDCIFSLVVVVVVMVIVVVAVVVE